MSVSLKLQHRLPGFSLDVAWEAGDETVVLFGFSGSGKSMTLQMLAGLARPEAGRVALGERVLLDTTVGVDLAPQQRPFGYVFQDPALFPHMTVRANIEYGLHGLERAERAWRAEGTAEVFGLRDLLDRRPAQLSGGQRQRVALARVLAREPEALLLDEPFSALDAPVRMEMRELVAEVRERYAVPVILVTHDLLEAYTMADRMLVYMDGRVVQAGTPDEILDTPASDEVARLLSTQRYLRLNPQCPVGARRLAW
jgi:molybdate transport system ATP-binding protein